VRAGGKDSRRRYGSTWRVGWLWAGRGAERAGKLVPETISKPH
jgi:hypothetical protein